MSLLKKFFLPLFIIILTVVLLNVFRILPVSKLFNGYAVMFVETAVPQKNVESLLLENGANDIVFLENQKVPLNLPEQSPEVALAKSGIEKSKYLEERNAFFFDKAKSCNIFYIPNDFYKSAEKTADFFVDNGFFAGLNASASFPVISVLIIVLFSVFLMYFSENHILSGLLFVLPVFFSFMIPFNSVSAALCLFELGVFLCIKFEGREGAVFKLAQSVMIVSFFATSALIVFFTSFRAGFIFILFCLAEVSVFVVYSQVCAFFEKRYSFKPVNIISANSISILNRKNVKSLAVCACAVFVIFISALFSVNFSSFSKNSKKVQLPSAYSATSALPDISDFISWKWEAVTFPYVSINSKNRNEESVVFKNYSEKNGLISESLNYISYNNDFRNNALSEIELLDYPALEKILLSQGKKAKFGYAQSGTQNISLLMIVLLAAAFFIPLFFYLNEKRIGRHK